MFTCSTSKTVTLDLIEDNATKNFTSQEKEPFCGKQGIRLIYFKFISFNLDGSLIWMVPLDVCVCVRWGRGGEGVLGEVGWCGYELF